MVVIFYGSFNKSFLYTILLFFIPLSISIKILGDFEMQIPSEPIIALLVILFIFSFKNSKADLKKLIESPITKIICLEIIWSVICSIFSELPQVSFKYTVVRICYVVAFYILTIYWFEKYKKPLYFFIIYAIGFIIPIVNGLKFHALYNFSQKVSFPMPQPFFSDHTVYGACLAFLIPILLGAIILFVKFNKNWWSIAFLFLLLLLFLLAEYFSFSRASWLSLAMAFFLFLLLKMGLTSRIFLIGIFSLVMLAWINQDRLIAKMNESKSLSNIDDLKQQITSITNIQTDASNTERINRWKCAIRMGFEKPVFGFGPRTYKFIYANYQAREDLSYISTYNGDKGNAHSEYLSYFAECGIVGAIIHLLFFLIPLLFGIDLVKKCKHPKNKILATSLLLGFFTYSIHGLFNGFMEEEKMSSLVFISIAALYAIGELEKRDLEVTI